jgi:hypothetical protein
MMEKAYVSTLAPFMEDFVAFKHSLGLKYITGEFYLREFDSYCAKNESETTTLKYMIRNWMILKNTESSNTHRVRLTYS